MLTTVRFFFSFTYQSEYVHPCDGRREYISGFSGSAGTAVITKNHAALWTDGRYFLQAEEQLDCQWILMKTGQPGVSSHFYFYFIFSSLLRTPVPPSK